MGGAEIGGIFNRDDYTEAEVKALETIREINPEKFGHVVFSDEVPMPDAIKGGQDAA